MSEQDRMGQELTGDALLIVQAARIIQKGISTRHDGDALTVLQKRLEEDCRKDCDGYWEQHKRALALIEERKVYIETNHALGQLTAQLVADIRTLAQKWRDKDADFSKDMAGTVWTNEKRAIAQAELYAFERAADELEALVKP